MSYLTDNLSNWKDIYPTYVSRWKDKYSIYIDDGMWNGICIDCKSATDRGKGWRNCDLCYIKYVKVRQNYVAKARNLMRIKTNKYCEFTGCNKAEFINYIETQFHSGMSWDNYSKIWQIDHIIPSAWFDFNDINEIKICCNYNNLQPLLIKDNQDKNATIE